MNNLFSVLLSTLKAKITPLWTKLRYWTSWTFIKSSVLSRIRQGLSGLFNIKPRNKKDYYTFFGWLVSRRLAHAVVIALGLVCLVYLFYVNPIFDQLEAVGTGDRIYSYASIPLRFAKGEVQIKAKSGYIAYKGEVRGGYAEGYGELYDEYGSLVYQGNFVKSRYEGEGALYNSMGQVRYQGSFQDNFFQGQGVLYRENGVKEYEGGFAVGEKEGNGVLYDGAENPIFTGSFHNDELVYGQLLDKNAGEISAMYTGTDLLYQGNGETVRILEDIRAFYVMGNENDSVMDEARTDRIYVAKDYFAYGDQTFSDIAGLKEELGEPVFEGNSYLTFPEAVGIDWMEKKGMESDIDPALEIDQTYKEAYTVRSYNREGALYLYAFQKDEMTITFLSEGRDGTFFMYVIEE